MTDTPTPALTAESEALLADVRDSIDCAHRELTVWVDRDRAYHPGWVDTGYEPWNNKPSLALWGVESSELIGSLYDRLAAIEAAAVARHVRETGCEGYREFAESVVRQWGYVSGGAVSAGGLSTLEEAFDILGWDDPHPLAQGDPAVCDEPGCGAASSSGWPSPSGYRHTCDEHSDWHVQRKCNWPADSDHWRAGAALATPAATEEEYPDEGDPGPFLEGITPAASPEARGGGCDGTCMGWASPGPCPACVEPYQPAASPEDDELGRHVREGWRLTDDGPGSSTGRAGEPSMAGAPVEGSLSEGSSPSPGPTDPDPAPALREAAEVRESLLAESLRAILKAGLLSGKRHPSLVRIYDDAVAALDEHDSALAAPTTGTAAACAREGCGHREVRHYHGDSDSIPFCDPGYGPNCPCTGFLATGRED